MARFIMRRVAVSVPLLLGVSVLVFALVANAGDPLQPLYDQPDIAPEVIAARRHELHLDQPVLARYWRWLTHFLRGDFGTSNNGQPVRTLLWQRMQVTLRMVVLATILSLVVGFALGVVGAVRHGTLFDQSSRALTYLFVALPAFFVAGLLQEYGAVRLNHLFGHQLVFTVGEANPNLTGSFLHRLSNYAGHLLLPTIALALAPIAVWSRYLRASVLDVLEADYLRTARAKGLSEARVVLRHGLRNALIPLTTIVALDFAHVFAGAVIVERAFSWHGMGEMLIDGVTTADPNVVLAWLMVTATAVLAFNLLADLAYGWLDPRVRLD
jgi:peptide/nickel transport system permease protein